jgi:NADH-quinone oxidoreductase subunit C
VPDERPPAEEEADASPAADDNAAMKEEGDSPEEAQDEEATSSPEVTSVGAYETPTAGAEGEVVDSQHEPMLDALTAGLGEEAVVAAASNHGDLVVRVKLEAWGRAGEVARRRLHCDYLSFLSGIDWQPRSEPEAGEGEASAAPVQPKEMTFGVAGSEGRFQVMACVESTSRHHQLILKADVDEDAPSVPSWVEVYPGADWHERECWEMFGFQFDGHPHLRHLYLPGEFEGYPLRKDFPLLAREVKPWPGLVDVELMPDEEAAAPDGEGEEAEDEADEGGGEDE